MRHLACGLVAALLALAAWAESAEAPASDAENKGFTRTLRSVTADELVERGLEPTGVYEGSPKVLANRAKYAAEFYNTLASYRGEPIPQYVPPPCDQPQPTGYDAEGCRIVNAMYGDVEDPVKREAYREQVRRGRDVWFKGTFGNQDYFRQWVGFGLYGEERQPDYSHWLDTRNRDERYAKWGMINDPDCTAGDETTFWLDRCSDPHATGVIGLRKYLNNNPPEGFDPVNTPYQEGEISDGRRYLIGQACAVCHAAFDPTFPPADPNHPSWKHISGHIGNQYTNNTMQFFGNLPQDHYARRFYDAIEPGQVDTSSGHMDFVYNPGTQNNITDLQNRPLFIEDIKHPITGEVRPAPTRHVLKGGEDSVGEHLAMMRVYLNIGMCFRDCSEPVFPEHGARFGEKARYRPFSAKQCYQACEPWNQADAKMGDLTIYLAAGGPFYLRDATDLDGTPGADYIDDAQVPRGRKVFARECASCHSSKVAPDSIRADREALERFYEGHVFGREADWRDELGAVADGGAFSAKHLREGRPVQFAANDVFGQDWLGNDELIPHGIVGTNRCRSMHGNQVPGAVWAEFSSETYKQRAAPPGEYPKTFNPLIPLIGGRENPFGILEEIDQGRGYYRNVSLLSIWSHAPFLHNNTLGPLLRRPDGAIAYTVRARIEMFEAAMNDLLMSDNPKVTPHRTPKVTRFPMDFKMPHTPGGNPWIPIDAGTPVVHVLSVSPYAPVFLSCADEVENKGHQFGVDLSAEDKRALIEFLKTV